LLDQVAIHIRGRLTSGGHPLADRAVTLRAGSRFLGVVRTASDGSYGLHYVVVPRKRWQQTHARYERQFRSIVAAFAGTQQLLSTRARAAVTGP
jgi:hypothetical protein